MNQLCRVCEEPAAGFHFGAFTCEGCKSFFGRTHNNLSQIHECKNGGSCLINKQNRTSCKACRLKKCLVVGMSKSGSKYGRRSNWFKIHCLLQEQQAAQANKSMEGAQMVSMGVSPNPLTSLSPTFVNSLSSNPMTSLSPCRNDEESKSDTSALSSPDSESSIDIIRRTCRKDPTRGDHLNLLPSNDFVANLGLYSLHPGLSLLHASHLYSRLYPPVMYPSLPPGLLTSSRSPPMSHSPLGSPVPHSPPLPLSPSMLPHSPPTLPHSPPMPHSPLSSHSSPVPPHLHSYLLQHSPPSIMNLMPRSPLSPRISSPPNPLKRRAETPDSDQDAPIDLTVKRPRIHSPSPQPGCSPPVTPIVTILPLAALTPTAPVNLTTRA